MSTIQITYSFDADDVATAGDWELGDDKDADESAQICDSFLQQKYASRRDNNCDWTNSDVYYK